VSKLAPRLSPNRRKTIEILWKSSAYTDALDDAICAAQPAVVIDENDGKHRSLGLCRAAEMCVVGHNQVAPQPCLGNIHQARMGESNTRSLKQISVGYASTAAIVLRLGARARIINGARFLRVNPCQ
jgi:hypothetical protein